MVIPIGTNYYDKKRDPERWEKAQAVEQILAWLQHVTLSELCTETIDFRAVKNAIMRSNYWTERRLRNSISVEYRQTKDLKDDWQHLKRYINESTYVVSMSPELSLATSRTFIPVVHVPPEADCPCPTEEELGSFLKVIGHMVMRVPTPDTTLARFGGVNQDYPQRLQEGQGSPQQI